MPWLTKWPKFLFSLNRSAIFLVCVMKFEEISSFFFCTANPKWGKKKFRFSVQWSIFFSFTPNLCVMKYFNMYCVLFKEKFLESRWFIKGHCQLVGCSLIFWLLRSVRVFNSFSNNFSLFQIGTKTTFYKQCWPDMVSIQKKMDKKSAISKHFVTL